MTFRISIVLAALAAAAIAVKNGGVQGAVLETASLENDVNGVAMVGGDANEAAELPKSDESEQLLPLQDSLSGSHLMEEFNSDSERDEGLSPVPATPRELSYPPLNDTDGWFRKARECAKDKPVSRMWEKRENRSCAGEITAWYPTTTAKCCERLCVARAKADDRFTLASFSHYGSDVGMAGCFCMSALPGSRESSSDGVDCYVPREPSWDLLDSQQCADPMPVPVTDYWVLQEENGPCYAGEVLRSHRQVPNAKCCEDACNGARNSQCIDGGAALAQYTDHTCFLYNPEADPDVANCLCMTDCVELPGRGRSVGECYVTERTITQCTATAGPLEEPWVEHQGLCMAGKKGDWLGSSYTHEVITSAKCCEQFCHQFHPATTCVQYLPAFPQIACHCFKACPRIHRRRNAWCFVQPDGLAL